MLVPCANTAARLCAICVKIGKNLSSGGICFSFQIQNMNSPTNSIELKLTKEAQVVRLISVSCRYFAFLFAAKLVNKHEVLFLNLIENACNWFNHYSQTIFKTKYFVFEVVIDQFGDWFFLEFLPLRTRKQTGLNAFKYGVTNVNYIGRK